MSIIVKRLIKNILHDVGLDLVRYHENPKNTLLGLRSRPIRTILDIGANVGQSAKLYRRWFEDAIIYSFEPLPEVYQILESWARTQGGKVKTFNMALGSDLGSITMNNHVDHSPSSSLLDTTNVTTDLYPQTRNQTAVLVPLERLDNLAKLLELYDEILVKMDVQGYETKVIQGGRRVIERAVGCIVEVNLQSLYEGQSSFREIVSSMYDLGFVFGGNLSQFYDRNGYVVYVDAVFLKDGCLEGTLQGQVQSGKTAEVTRDGR